MDEGDEVIVAILQGDDGALRDKLAGVSAATLNKPTSMRHKVQHVCGQGEMMTPLALAAGWGKAKCVTLLLEARATPNARRGEGGSEHWKTVPLHWACGNRQVDCATLLLDAAATIDTKRENGGLTALGVAALDGHLDVARLLVERGCNVNLPRDTGASPLYGACQEGQTAVARLLIHAQADLNQLRTASGATPLFAAALHGHGDVVELMLAARADATQKANDGWDALAIAKDALRKARGPSPRKAVALLEVHAATASAAAEATNDAMAASTAAAPPPPAGMLDVSDGGSASPAGHAISSAELIDLIRRGQTLRLEALLARPSVTSVLDVPAAGGAAAGLPSHAVGRTALVAACMLRTNPPFQLSTVRLLLDARASAAAVCADGNKSFALMAALQHPACVSLLLERHADVAQVDAEGYSPLLAACEWGCSKVVRLLLASGAQTAFEGKEAGFTPLVAAAMGGKHVCVRALLEAGVEPCSPLCFKRGAPFAVPKEGLTALGWAARGQRYAGRAAAQSGTDYKEVCKLLGEYDALFGEARRLGVISATDLEAQAARIASAEPTARFALRAQLVAEHRERVHAAGARQQVAETRAREEARRAFERAPHAAVDAAALWPKGEQPVFGGKCRIYGLTTAVALNGQEGAIVSYNLDGKRRFGVQLTLDGKLLAVLPANLVPVDKTPMPTCMATSSEVCDALREAFAEDGSSRFNSTVYYVQRCVATEAFFLTSRELMEAPTGCASDTAMGSGACTLPWLLYSGLQPGCEAVLTPNGNEAWYAETAFIARYVSNSLSEDLACAVCMERLKVCENPTQLPCAHFLCVGCLQKLFPINKKGMTCPVCRRDHATYCLVTNTSAPGGVAVAQVMK